MSTIHLRIVFAMTNQNTVEIQFQLFALTF